MRSPHNPTSDRVSGAGAPATWGDALGIGLLAAAARFLHLLTLRSVPTFESYVMDEAYHDAWAKRLAAGDWVGSEVFFRAPLYPYLLGVIYRTFGAGGFAPRVVQCLIGAVSVVLLHRIGLRLAGKRAAAVAALVMALSWPLIYYDNELLITVLEVLLSLATILILLKTADAGNQLGLFFCGGAALGLAAIARPNMLFFAPAAIAWVAAARPPVKGRTAASAALLAGLILPILPVTVRNYAVAGDLVLISSQGGLNFYIGNNPEADGTTAIVPGTRPTWQGGYEDTIGLAKQAEGRDLSASGVSRYWFRRGLSFWRDQPRAAAALLLRKTILLLGGVEISNNKDLTFFRSLSPVLSLPLPASWLLAPLGIAGWAAAWTRGRDRRRLLALPLLFAATYAASIILFFVTSRFRAPLLPVYALGVALLVEEMMSLLRARRRAAVAMLAVSTAGLLLLLNLNPYGYRDDPGQGHMSLALALHQAGRPSEALAECDHALAFPGPYRYEVLKLKGEVLAAMGRIPEAIGAFEQSLSDRPDNVEAVASLLQTGARSGSYERARGAALRVAPADGPLAGEIHFAVGSMDQLMGRGDLAEEQYRLALSVFPGHLGARVNLALLLRGTGRLAESLEELLEAERVDPRSAIVHLHLAKHYLFIGDRERALRHASLAEAGGARLDPDFQRALGRR